MFFLNLLHSLNWFRKKHHELDKFVQKCTCIRAELVLLLQCVQMFWPNLRAEQANSPRLGSWAALHLTYWRGMPLCMVSDLWTITLDNLHSSFICLSCVSFMDLRAAQNPFTSTLSLYCPSNKPGSILIWMNIRLSSGNLEITNSVHRIWTQTIWSKVSTGSDLWISDWFHWFNIASCDFDLTYAETWHMKSNFCLLFRKPRPAFPCGHVGRLRQGRQVKAP